MIFEISGMLPKMKETRSKLNNPISPQFKAPIIAIVRAIHFKYFIVTPFSHIVICGYTFIFDNKSN